MVVMFDYLLCDEEIGIVCVCVLVFVDEVGCLLFELMVSLVELMCNGFVIGDLLMLMLLCMVINWVENC